MADYVPPFSSYSKFLKCTLILTDKCNLACSYCYAQKKNSTMLLETAQKIVDFVFSNSRKDETIQFGFFGGEPLLEFDLIKGITKLIRGHSSFRPYQTSISIATNGTIFSEEISDFFAENDITPCFSCDGPPEIHDLNRHFPDGRGSSTFVESNIKKAVSLFPVLRVNAVYSPNTLQFLPDVVEYLVSLGIKNICLSHNFSAKWTQEDAKMVPKIYDAIGEQFIDFYLRKKPIYISLIDSKIAAILREGFTPYERCRMGKGELAFSTSGKVYPCEILAGSNTTIAHCIGDINGETPAQRRHRPIISVAKNSECQVCSLKKYCVNWCGCSNFFATGCYNRVGPFECASERAAIGVASKVIRRMKDNSAIFSHHLNGMPLMNVI
jgi:uncharacterized protein